MPTRKKRTSRRAEPAVLDMPITVGVCAMDKKVRRKLGQRSSQLSPSAGRGLLSRPCSGAASYPGRARSGLSWRGGRAAQRRGSARPSASGQR